MPRQRAASGNRQGGNGSGVTNVVEIGLKSAAADPTLTGIEIGLHGERHRQVLVEDRVHTALHGVLLVETDRCGVVVGKLVAVVFVRQRYQRRKRWVIPRSNRIGVERGP